MPVAETRIRDDLGNRHAPVEAKEGVRDQRVDTAQFRQAAFEKLLQHDQATRRRGFVLQPVANLFEVAAAPQILETGVPASQCPGGGSRHSSTDPGRIIAPTIGPACAASLQ